MAAGDGGSVTVNEGSLPDLYRREQFILRSIARRDRSGIKVVGAVVR